MLNSIYYYFEVSSKINFFYIFFQLILLLLLTFLFSFNYKSKIKNLF
jgi:hypothetical protein